LILVYYNISNLTVNNSLMLKNSTDNTILTDFYLKSKKTTQKNSITSLTTRKTNGNNIKYLKSDTGIEPFNVNILQKQNRF